MKRIVAFLLSAFILTACANQGNERNDQKQTVETEYPPTGTDKVQGPDTSTTGVQDSSTTVGYDTSSVRKN